MFARTAYYPLATLMRMIDEPNRSVCLGLYDEHRELFRQAPGSTHNHQAWAGGYHDHVTEVMNLALLLHDALLSTGRLEHLASDEQFSASDALLVLFLHDIEKLWRCVLVEGMPVLDESGRFQVHPELESKAARLALAAAKIAEYGFQLTPQQQNALRYVEGMRDGDYRQGERVMLPLAAFCHACDLWSARLFYDFPRRSGDPWSKLT